MNITFLANYLANVLKKFTLLKKSRKKETLLAHLLLQQYLEFYANVDLILL